MYFLWEKVAFPASRVSLQEGTPFSLLNFAEVVRNHRLHLAKPLAWYPSPGGVAMQVMTSDRNTKFTGFVFQFFMTTLVKSNFFDILGSTWQKPNFIKMLLPI